HALLNDTKLGPMLAELGRQALGGFVAATPERAMPKASDLADLVAAIARDGFALGVAELGDRQNEPPLTFVISNGAKNGAVELVRRLAVKAREVRKGSRMFHVTGEGDKASGWWVEGDHLIIVGPPLAHADAVLDVIDGKAPAAAGLPAVAELKKSDAGTESV